MRMTNVTFRKLYSEHKESGLSIRDFCANQDIAVSTFYYWNKKQKKQECPPIDFVPLAIGGQQTISIANENVDYHNTPLEFVFPNGTRMLLNEDIDITLLKTIVHLYD
ncbi:MAG: IS66 family insertion sequence element accessory protein TnpB [Marinilabiliaceae bacterium]|nr:IS66 family insertion sequence element accessory protein TnpB [Marinilabiliaceae bacterium]